MCSVAPCSPAGARQGRCWHQIGRDFIEAGQWSRQASLVATEARAVVLGPADQQHAGTQQHQRQCHQHIGVEVALPFVQLLPGQLGRSATRTGSPTVPTGRSRTPEREGDEAPGGALEAWLAMRLADHPRVEAVGRALCLHRIPDRDWSRWRACCDGAAGFGNATRVVERLISQYAIGYQMTQK